MTIEDEADDRECVNCGKPMPGAVWLPGECCLFGCLAACSRDCARRWAADNAAGIRPGFLADLESHVEETPPCP